MTSPVTVPPQLAAKAERGPDWAAWIAQLPRTASEILDAWQLIPDGQPAHGETALVLPVRDASGRRLALKIAFAEPDNAGEPEALKAWRGLGAVRLEAADPHRGVLLLERAGPRDLHALDALDACAIVGRLYPRLHLPAGPRVPPLAPLIGGWLDGLDALGRVVPAPPRFVQQALHAGRALASDLSVTSSIVHGDLHYSNVLEARREPWLAIDPKGFAGDPCFEPAPMLWNRWQELGPDLSAGLRDRFYAIVDAAGLDERRCRDWVVVRSMIGVYWEVDDARRAGRPLSESQQDWITRLITTAKAMQAVE